MINFFRSFANRILGVPYWQHKCWGKVWHRFNDNIINESLLSVNQGWQCSVHYHKHRYNAFIATSAIIAIEIWTREQHHLLLQAGKNSSKDISDIVPPTYIHYIHPGQSYVVAPSIIHRFSVIQSGQLIEIYWTNDNSKCEMEDIYRLTEGGKKL